MPPPQTMDHDRLGSRCFQKGDHLGALEHFDKAIKSSSPKLVPAILNKRSLVYIKLEKFQQALRDGREIIKRMPDMAMGYLRCGQVVQLMGQRDKALEILERGMLKVPEGSNGDRKTLSKHYDALRRQSQGTKGLDPLTKLPQEIAQQVWEILDVKSRGRCLSVSKGWKKSLESYPPLWQDLVISSKMSATALTAWFSRVERSGYSMCSATITTNDFNNQCQTLLRRIQRRPKLERFVLDVVSVEANILLMLPQASQHLKTLTVSAGSWVPISTVKQIMTSYPHLEHVEFHGIIRSNTQISWPEMPCLRTAVLQALEARNCRNLQASGRDLEWNELIKASPNMESATIKHWRHAMFPGVIDLANWTKLTYIDVSKTRFHSIPTFPGTLTHFAASETTGVASDLIAYSELDNFHFPNLEYLDVNDSDFSICVNDIANPGLISGSLKTLDLGGAAFLRDIGSHRWPEKLPAPSPALETLSLRSQTELPEKIIISLLRQYPNLKNVDLGVTGVTGSTLRELFERENKPNFIDLEGCDDCYYDAVEAARESGIEVLHELAPKKKMYKGKRHPTYY